VGFQEFQRRGEREGNIHAVYDVIRLTKKKERRPLKEWRIMLEKKKGRAEGIL